MFANVFEATNQLLTAFDRLRNLPNVIVLCTSNLVEAIVISLRPMVLMITANVSRTLRSSIVSTSSNSSPVHLRLLFTTSCAHASMSCFGATWFRLWRYSQHLTRAKVAPHKPLLPHQHPCCPLHANPSRDPRARTRPQPLRHLTSLSHHLQNHGTSSRPRTKS